MAPYGAVLGVFVAGFFLLGFFGETVSLLIAATLNLIAALLAGHLQMKLKNNDPQTQQLKDAKRAVETPVGFSLRIRYWSRLAIFVSGFTALAYEILWGRFLMLPLRTSIYAFSFMLGLFLLGAFTRRSKSTGAVIGVICGIAIIAWMSLSSLSEDPSMYGNIFHSYLTIVFGTLAIFLAGFLISLWPGRINRR